MTEKLRHKPIDFEKWAELASTDPAEFEAMRRAAIDEFLGTVPAERRLQLQRLQWRVDRVRERCNSPMAATIAISNMMWDSFYSLNNQYLELFGTAAGKPKHTPTPRNSAKVLAFPGPVAG